MLTHIQHPPSGPHADSMPGGSRDVDLDALGEWLGYRSVRALRCTSCGYAIASYRTLPDCPMCHTRKWVADREMRPARGRPRT